MIAIIRQPKTERKKLIISTVLKVAILRTFLKCNFRKWLVDDAFIESSLKRKAVFLLSLKTVQTLKNRLPHGEMPLQD